MTSSKRYNPKSHTPAVYIPCWLAQISTSLLSTNAKMLYGRLSQWANSTGIVFRSLPQLAKELGTPSKTLERHLKELKDCFLIGTYHPQAGGVNYYEFLDHPWIHEPINDELVYKSDPTSEMRVPTPNNEGTLPPEMRHINKKEIKRNKKDIISDSKESPETISNQEIVNIYHELMPEMPKVEKIGATLKTQLNSMKRLWKNEYSHNNLPFTLETFKRFLLHIREYAPFFLHPYNTDNQNKRRSNLRTITRPKNLEKFRNNEFTQQ